MYFSAPSPGFPPNLTVSFFPSLEPVNRPWVFMYSKFSLFSSTKNQGEIIMRAPISSSS